MAPSAIEPATFRLVAHCLNQQRHRVTVLDVTATRYNVAQWLTFSTDTISTCIMSSKYDYDMITTMRTKKRVFMMIRARIFMTSYFLSDQFSHA
jgi:hypothetical protein